LLENWIKNGFVGKLDSKMDLLENWIQKWICCKIGFKNGFAGKLDWPKS
jgi:hypothetical protein